ncbi:hypothetical protein SAMN05216503_0765 [Polaribacter sp. KT25b]|uniref:hypothetical protein n=1 Tax=Polaribacter sp. KT25b TaxID=1855336 RepID=UPI000879E80C|nr:hypothetical protein [Polaribacter sp. KT25b]SDR75551.1 hypothetical protein SAMN05216503_0765 [Polaribacter sp. KT25b]
MKKMKQIILAIVLLVATVTQAQKSFFDNISEDDIYNVYIKMSKAGNGTYKAEERGTPVKFKKEYLPTGEGYKFSTILQEGPKKGETDFTVDISDKKIECKGYPYESVISGEDWGYRYYYVSIGDYVFSLKGVSTKFATFKGINAVYIKAGKPEKADTEKKTKKKNSFFSKMKALKNQALGSAGVFGSEYKEFKNKNMDKIITDYLVAMKAKQEGRTAAQKQSDTNVANLTKNKMAKEKAAKDASYAEAKKYNDSVKATPEWKDLERRKRQNEANYQSRQKADFVTLRNTSGSAIYVARSGSKNRGTKISTGGSVKWSCGQDAYIQVNNTTTNTKVYSKNSGCGNTITVR